MVCSALLVAVAALIAYANAPSWVLNTREWVIAGRLSVSAGVLGGIQLLLSWGLGMFGARGGALAAKGQGRNLARRLRIVRRRLFVPSLALVFVRIALLGVVALAVIYAYSELLGPGVFTGLPGLLRPATGYGLFVLAAVALLVPHWLIGPFLRVRYSTALGALAGTWARRDADRTALALSARLGAGLTGALALVWGWAGGLLAVLTIVNPSSYNTASYLIDPYASLPPLQPFLPFSAGLFVLIYAAGQLVLGEAYTVMAQRRLKRRWPRLTTPQSAAPPDPGSAARQAESSQPPAVSAGG
jgi:hypothetical protein